MKFLKSLTILLFLYSCSAQKKFQIIYDAKLEQNYVADNKGNKIEKIDKNYILAFQPDKLECFKILSGKKYWIAINISGEKLFEIPDEEYGIPSPAYLSQNRIRFIENKKIGFKNKKGKTIIPPKFEYAEQFYDGKSIIGENCVNKEIKDKPLNNSDSLQNFEKHYETVCKKFGLINRSGKIIKFGNYNYQEIRK